ncbi:hypothetical protein ACG97_03040 [Vogesella sp. EB]|nr:hypothetical protein ACG97_03040 [Vogesella sp. EB]
MFVIIWFFYRDGFHVCIEKIYRFLRANFAFTVITLFRWQIIQINLQYHTFSIVFTWLFILIHYYGYSCVGYCSQWRPNVCLQIDALVRTRFFIFIFPKHAKCGGTFACQARSTDGAVWQGIDPLFDSACWLWSRRCARLLSRLRRFRERWLLFCRSRLFLRHLYCRATQLGKNIGHPCGLVTTGVNHEMVRTKPRIDQVVG